MFCIYGFLSLFPLFFIFVRICLCILYIGGVMKRDTHHDNRIVFETQANLVFVFVFVFCIYIFCILLWWITLAVWWRETLTMTMERRDIYCHPFWSRDKGKKNHDILTTRQYFGRMFFFSQKIEIFGLHWHDMSASFKRFKLGCLYRSQKMLRSSIRGCSSRAL